MSNKILLITLVGTFNFGNRLQHYALQTAIERLGYEVDSLTVRPLPTALFKQKVKNVVKSVLVRSGFRRYQHTLSRSRRTEGCLEFNSRYLKNMVYMPVEQVPEADWSDYSCAVTGSDQVWHNWHDKYIPDELSYYYLEFIDPGKRISYAPSFGFMSFLEEDLEMHRQGLMGIRALSCREQEGCDLIYELTGRTAQKVLDPTLLLTAKEWAIIEKNPRFQTPDKYLIQFFLGEITDEYQMEIRRIANLRGLTVIDVNDIDDPKRYGTSPAEFVWLVHHADTICTDSFHASVFSITFGRNLRVFRRKQERMEDMFGRLHDLLAPLGLMDLVYGVGDGLSTELNEKSQNYLKMARQQSIAFLASSLK